MWENLYVMIYWILQIKMPTQELALHNFNVRQLIELLLKKEIIKR